MRSLSLVLVAALAPSGCFYVDTINDRPSAEIVRDATSRISRGGHLDVHAQVDDPNGDRVTFAWTARACGPGGVDCDAAPLAQATTPVFSVDIPAARTGGEPVVAVRTTLDVIDIHGAVAKPQQVLLTDVANSAPTVAVQAASFDNATSNTVTLPITFTARTSDGDDGADAVALTWALEPPFGAGAGDFEFVQLADPPGADGEREEAYRLTPAVTGEWIVRITATDPLGAIATTTIAVSVVPDRPPCIAASAPATPPADAVLVLDQPRRFEVLSVDDDLSSYPAPPLDDPYRIAATFRWSLATPATGGLLTELPDAAASGLELDPADYAPGDRVSVRVEIDDGEGRALPCAADAPTCSIELDACIQRLTWDLEVR